MNESADRRMRQTKRHGSSRSWGDPSSREQYTEQRDSRESGREQDHQDRSSRSYDFDGNRSYPRQASRRRYARSEGAYSNGGRGEDGEPAQWRGNSPRQQETRRARTPRRTSRGREGFDANVVVASPPLRRGPVDPFEQPVRLVDEERVLPDRTSRHSGSRDNSMRSPTPQNLESDDDEDEMDEVHLSPRHAAEGADGNGVSGRATFLVPGDIHPNMISREEDVMQLRLLAGKLSADWKGQDFMAPALARRIRDFQFAQEKRRRRYGDERPWGILGLYDHLASIRVDVEWAEDAAWRRANGEPYLAWSDFDASKKKGVNRPFFTYFLLVTCTALMVASIALNNWAIESLEVNPMIGPSAHTLIRMGAKDSNLIVNENEAWRLVSSTGLHAGIVHYFINMLALWFVGTAIERTHGLIAVTILFIIPAIGGSILSAIFLPEFITVGASGGIFGLIGACLSDIIMNWKLLFNDFVTENGKKHHHAMVVIFLLLDIALNSIIGLTPYVDNFTHLGGMLIGFLCGISTMERLSSDFFGMEQKNCWSQSKQLLVRFFGLIISVIGIMVATIILLEGDGETTPCPGCAWLSCVPFPPWEGQTDKWWYCDDCGRVTANVIENPSLHLELECPDKTSVPIELDPDEELDRDELEKNLPDYCRELCPSTDVRF